MVHTPPIQRQATVTGERRTVQGPLAKLKASSNLQF
jgi:hypothetical protein